MFQLVAMAGNVTRFTARAATLEQTAALVNSMRQTFPDYQIMVANNTIGRVHTFRAREPFSAAPLTD